MLKLHARDRAQPVVWLPALIWILPMTIAATVLRWFWLHLAPRRWRDATLPAVLVGLVSGPAGELLARTSLGMLRGEPETPVRTLSEMVASWDLSFAPPLLLGGAAAGYLAHHLVPVTSRRWWLVVVSTAVAGLLLLGPLSSDLPWGAEEPAERIHASAERFSMPDGAPPATGAILPVMETAVGQRPRN